MMLHNLHTLTLRRYGQIDSTEDLSLFKRWYNPFPVRWFNVQKVVLKVAQALDTGIDKQVTLEVGKLIAIAKIQKLQALHLGIYNLIVLKPANDQWGKTNKNNSGNLVEYLAVVKEVTGIIIKDLDGLERLKKEITRLNDKFVERFGTGEQDKGEKIPFYQFAFGVFAIMEMPYNSEMVLSEFIQMLEPSKKRAKELEKLRTKNKNG